MAEPTSREPERVRRMFGGIARRYDLLNRVLSLRRDVAWRRAAAREAAIEPGARLLDLCGGTGDLTAEVAAQGAARLVVCCDFCHPMLRIAERKLARSSRSDRCVLLEADGLCLPFESGCFDAVTVGFGVRNFVDLDAGLREILRVLRAGGRLVVLEFSRPHVRSLSVVYDFYLRRILPRIGDPGSGAEGPYGYLARTISEFPEPPALAGRIREAGFAAVAWKTMTGGIVAIHTARKGTGVEENRNGRDAKGRRRSPESTQAPPSSESRTAF